jgi:hypothetical protein
MNNRQRQLLVVFLASMGFGLLGGLVFSVTSQMIRPGKIDLNRASPDQQISPALKDAPLPAQNRRPKGFDCVVPPDGGPPVTKEFQPC